jgi:hypothetical protein
LCVNKISVAKYGQILSGQKSAMRLKGCGVMQGLIWAVISTGTAVFERTPPVQPASDFFTDRPQKGNPGRNNHMNAGVDTPSSRTFLLP